MKKLVLDLAQFKQISKYLRYLILKSTTTAGSGHPTSSLSAVELMVGLFFGGIFRTDLSNPKYANNDRLIFSKGHAAPLLYSLYVAAGIYEEADLMSLRKFQSIFEGHPTPRFPHTEVATGSLGQGLSIGVGMALNAMYLDKLPYRTYVLLGDSEMAEGSNWEAMQSASFYKLGNLTAILDVNRLGQSRETMYGYDLHSYEKKANAFGWKTMIIDGHNLGKIIDAYKWSASKNNSPTMIIAKTVKGKGVSFLEDKQNWHGKALSQDQYEKAIKEIGKVVKPSLVKVRKPKNYSQTNRKEKSTQYEKNKSSFPKYKLGDLVATRKAYGNALAKLGYTFPEIIALDAETKNSTYSEIFEKYHPNRFFEMFIAEQNMVGVALGLSKRGKVPFVSTFTSFFTRAYDQIRMSQYSQANIKFVGSHVGVSIGEDGPSQMGLEDISMFRSIHNAVVLYPSDAVSTEKLVKEAAHQNGIVYIRNTRKETPVIYDMKDEFPIGGSKILRSSDNDKVTVIAAGITLHEALKAYEALKKKNFYIRIIDLYSIKPIDKQSLQQASAATKAVITVEDHHPEGGLGEAVRSALQEVCLPIISLAVRKEVISGKPDELLAYEGIAALDIVAKVEELLK